MIISNGRFSTMNGNVVIAANENYSVNDIGTALLESVQNDMQIFNAILKSDYTEISARQEGTMLESELNAFTEASIKGLFQSLIDQLKKFWAKLKGIFKDAYAMIAAYCVRNGKVFVKTNKKAIEQLKDSDTVRGKIYVPKRGIDYLYHEGLTDKDTNKFLQDGKSSREIANSVMKDLFGSDKGDLFKTLKDKYFEEMENPALNQFGGAKVMCQALENGSTLIKGLNMAEKRIEGLIKAEIKKLQSEAKEAHLYDDKKEYKAKMYRAATSAVTAVSSAETRAKIRLAKFYLLQMRLGLARAITGEKPTNESAIDTLCAISEMEEIAAEDKSEMAPEMAEEVLEIVADAIEKAADDVGGDDDGAGVDED